MRNLVKRSIAALVLAIMCLGLFPVFAVQAAEKYNTDVKKSVVVVRFSFVGTDGGLYYSSTGSGFFVGEPGEDPKYVVTNHHVIDSYLEYGQGEIVTVTEYDTQGNVTAKRTGRATLFVHYTYTDFEEIYFVDANSAKDLAILELDAPTSKKQPLTLATVTDELVGEDIYAVGYPGLSDSYVVGAVESWDEKGVTVYSGIVSRLLTESGSGQKQILTNATIQHGHSGGPMVTSEGYVVGINVSKVMSTDYDTLEQEYGYFAVNVNDLIPMLKEHNVSFKLVDLYASTPDPVGPTPTPIPEPEPDNTLLLVVIIVAVLLVAVLVVVIVLVSKNKKPAPAPAPMPAPAPAPAPAPTPMRRGVLRSMSQQHMGMAIPLTPGQEIYIGRSTSVCRMVFQDNTPGVSSKHCSLTYDANTNQFVLIDLQSTYGTYLANGQRLTPGVGQYVKAGECFYLGEKANMLRVEVE